MKRKLSFVLTIVMLLTIFTVATRQAAADDAWTSFTAQDTVCSQEPGQLELAGNAMHITGQINHEVIQSDEDRVDGIITVVVNGVVNLHTGDGHFFGDFVLEPDAYDGTFAGHFSVQIADGVLTGHSLGHGTGELTGHIYRTDLSGFIVPDDPPCSNPLGTLHIDGQLLAPQGS